MMKSSDNYQQGHSQTLNFGWARVEDILILLLFSPMFPQFLFIFFLNLVLWLGSSPIWKAGRQLSGGTRTFLWGGVSRGQNMVVRGQKSKNLQKMADFGHCFLLTGGKWGQSLQLEDKFPLEAATEAARPLGKALAMPLTTSCLEGDSWAQILHHCCVAVTLHIQCNILSWQWRQ